jgi:hypothetical protein
MSDPTSESFDPQTRRLCPDGGCIGVIGDDGRCSECGREYVDDGSAQPGLGPEAFAGGCATEDEGGDAPLAAEGASDATDFDAGRPLCPDGACIGVLGADGRCEVCGRAPEA